MNRIILICIILELMLQVLGCVIWLCEYVHIIFLVRLLSK